MLLRRIGQRVSLAAKTGTALGPRRLWLRLRYELAKNSGWLQRRYPAAALSNWLPNPGARDAIVARLRERGLFFRLEKTSFRDTYRQFFPLIEQPLLQEANRFAAGEQEYFSQAWFPFDPQRDWFRNPFTDQVIGTQAHWTKVSWNAPESGDLKFQLEPARFGFVFKLARAYHYTADERFAAAFWSLFDGWAAQNPPQAGPLWICGQESALRLMAMAFGLWAFLDSAQSNLERIDKLIASIAAHADRILGTTVYARSQQNNHALSEAAGLLTAGCILAEFPAAQRWRQAANAIFADQVERQIYDDGSYIQHSHNYHRVMLHDLLWADRVGARHGAPLSEEIRRRAALAGQFLRAMLDPITGQVPNYGANDGALVLPLSVCDFKDFRPVVQAAATIFGGAPTLPPGDWDEDVLWLAGPAQFGDLKWPMPLATVDDPAKPAQMMTSQSFPTGGYDVIRGAETWAMTRAALYRDRPSQADQLHVDIWWRGLNVACDAGAYLYNSPPPWDNGLARTDVHNTVSVDQQDQMQRAGRFLWVDWAQAVRTSPVRSPGGQFDYWSGAHRGYRHLAPAVDHRRELLRLGPAHWLVLDRLTSTGAHHYRLHWLCPDAPHVWDENVGRLSLDTPSGAYQLQCGIVYPDGSGNIRYSLVRGDEGSTRGWRSLRYGNREAALSVACEIDAASVLFWTVLGPPLKELAIEAQRITLEIEAGKVEIRLAARAVDSSMVAAHWTDATSTDDLRIS